MEPTFAAYLAGLIDGEGTIGIGIRSPNPKMREKSQQLVTYISVTMCDEGLIRSLHEETGLGKVYQRKSKNAAWSDSWQWAIGSTEGVGLLREVLPYLRLKKTQAELYLELIDLRSQSARAAFNPERQMEIALECQRLNKRGA